MSVLIYKDGVFAADTAGFEGVFRVVTSVKKIVRAKSGALIGGAGRWDHVRKFIEWD